MAVFSRQQVESHAKGGRGAPTRIAQQGMPQGFNVGAVLQRERAKDCGVARRRIESAAGAIVGQEDFRQLAGERPINEIPDSRRVPMRFNVERKGHGGAPIGEPVAMAG
jgi:hypothetical protein